MLLGAPGGPMSRKRIHAGFTKRQFIKCVGSGFGSEVEAPEEWHQVEVDSAGELTPSSVDSID